MSRFRAIRYAWPLLLVAALLLAACQPQTVEVEVTRQIEVEVTREVVTEKEIEVTREVVTEKEVEKEVEVEVTAVPGRCAKSLEEVDEILIGATAPLSAPGSVGGGLAMQWAFNVAVDHINADGGILGKPVNMIFYDTEGLSERGTAVMERLITQDCVPAVVGEYHSAVGLTMKEVSHKYHVPTVFAETWNDDITGIGYDEVFRIAPTSSMVSEVDAMYLANLGFEFVVIVAENSDYGVPAAAALEEFLAAGGIGSETYLVEMGQQDMVPVISRIQAGPVPGAVIALITGETSYNFEQQAAEAGLMPNEDTVCIANQVAIQPEFWTNVPDGNYCAFRKVGLVPALANEVTDRFQADYRTKFDHFPESYALESYDAMLIMADAIERAGSLDPDAIIAALEETDIVLTQGRYYFPYTSANSSVDRECVNGLIDQGGFGSKCMLQGDDVPEGTPGFMWHQWPDPAVLYLQYFEVGQSGEDAAVVYPEVYQTHGTNLIPFGTTP